MHIRLFIYFVVLQLRKCSNIDMLFILFVPVIDTHCVCVKVQKCLEQFRRVLGIPWTLLNIMFDFIITLLRTIPTTLEGFWDTATFGVLGLELSQEEEEEEEEGKEGGRE